MKLLIIITTFLLGVNQNYFLQNFRINETSVGNIVKGMTIGEVIKNIPDNQVVKKIGYGEFQDDTYDDYEIFDSNGNHLLTVTPKEQNNPSATINRVLILDSRYKTVEGLTLNSNYGDLLKIYKVDEYSPVLDNIVLSINQISAWLSISKSELDKDWWDEETKKINANKIPHKAKLSSFVIWWN